MQERGLQVDRMASGHRCPQLREHVDRPGVGEELEAQVELLGLVAKGAQVPSGESDLPGTGGTTDPNSNRAAHVVR
jgi:hypothetical protein